MRSRILWRLLWLLGFRVWDEGDTAYVKLPGWLPQEEQQKLADRLATSIKKELEHIDPDYASAAQAWMVLEMTKEMIRHREECISIAEEYQRRLAEEQKSREIA